MTEAIDISDSEIATIVHSSITFKYYINSRSMSYFISCECSFQHRINFQICMTMSGHKSRPYQPSSCLCYDITTMLPQVIKTSFDLKKVMSLKAELDILQQDGKMEGVIENDKAVLDSLIISFESKTIVTTCRIATQLPLNSSKSEWINRELVITSLRASGTNNALHWLII